MQTQDVDRLSTDHFIKIPRQKNTENRSKDLASHILHTPALSQRKAQRQKIPRLNNVRIKTQKDQLLLLSNAKYNACSFIEHGVTLQCSSKVPIQALALK